MASAATKLGIRVETRTTRDSAATRSRKSHIMYVKKASAVDFIPTRKTVTMENRAEMRKRKGNPMRKLERRKEVGPYSPFPWSFT